VLWIVLGFTLATALLLWSLKLTVQVDNEAIRDLDKGGPPGRGGPV
jgi:hypothetical protein